MSNPVSETEVPDLENFFSRISTTIVAHSQQVRELSSIRSQLDSISNRLGQLETENTKLREDLSSAWQSFEREKQGRILAEDHATIAAKDAMAARTETVQVRQEFEQKLGMAHDQIDTRDTRIRQLEDQLAASDRESHDWQTRSNRYEAMAKASEDKLGVVQHKLEELNNSFRSLFEPKVEIVQSAHSTTVWSPEPDRAELVSFAEAPKQFSSGW